MDAKTLLKANNLSFCRSIEPSEALMFGVRKGKPASEGDAVNRDAFIPVTVEQKTVRGTISNAIAAGKTYNHESPNLQSIDIALMPPGCDRLLMTYSVTFVANSLKPYATNNAEVSKSYRLLAAEYDQAGGYLHLAKRYLWNTINGRVFWRNALIMFDKKIEIRVAGKLRATVSPGSLELRSYPGDDAMKEVMSAQSFDQLTSEIASALSGKGSALVLDVLMYGTVGSGMQVFPSQEFVRGEEAEKLKRANGNFSVGKVLASTDITWNNQQKRQAVMHTQKVGNALRWIDEWHGDAEHGAVPVDPYAALTLEAKALRSEKGKANFYAYLNQPSAVLNPLNNSTKIDSAEFGATHYFMAMLIRGGLFGSKSDDKAAEAA